MLVFRHDGDGDERLHAGLTDGEKMCARPDRLDEADDVVDVVVDAEPAGFERHVAGVDPVGDVDVVIAKQRLASLRQKRREMPRQRRDDQDFRLRRVDVLAKVQKLPERQAQRNFLGDRHVAISDPHLRDAELRPRVGQLEARNHLESGSKMLLYGIDGRQKPMLDRGLRVSCGLSQRSKEVVLKLVGLVEHRARISSSTVEINRCD